MVHILSWDYWELPDQLGLWIVDGIFKYGLFCICCLVWAVGVWLNKQGITKSGVGWLRPGTGRVRGPRPRRTILIKQNISNKSIYLLSEDLKHFSNAYNLTFSNHFSWLYLHSDKWFWFTSNAFLSITGAVKKSKIFVERFTDLFYRFPPIFIPQPYWKLLVKKPQQATSS